MSKTIQWTLSFIAHYLPQRDTQVMTFLLVKKRRWLVAAMMSAIENVILDRYVLCVQGVKSRGGYCKCWTISEISTFSLWRRRRKNHVSLKWRMMVKNLDSVVTYWTLYFVFIVIFHRPIYDLESNGCLASPLIGDSVNAHLYQFNTFLNWTSAIQE